MTSGLVVQDDRSPKYRIGIGAAHLPARCPELHDLRAASERAAVDLATDAGETVQLSTRCLDHVLTVAEITRDNDATLIRNGGALQPLAITAAGRVIAAHDPTGRGALIAREAGIEDLEMQAIAENGWAVTTRASK